MSEPLNEEDSRAAYLIHAMSNLYCAFESAVFYSELACEKLRGATDVFRLGGEHDLVELSYLNDSIIPKGKALIL